MCTYVLNKMHIVVVNARLIARHVNLVLGIMDFYLGTPLTTLEKH